MSRLSELIERKCRDFGMPMDDAIRIASNELALEVAERQAEATERMAGAAEQIVYHLECMAERRA